MNRRRRGYMLLIAIVLCGAVGVTLALAGRQLIGLTKQASLTQLDVRACQLIADAQAWIASHPDKCAALGPGEVISLSMNELLQPGATGVVEIAKDNEESGLLIKATVRQGRFASTMHVRHAPF